MIENLKGELWKQYRDTDYYFSSYGRVKRKYRNKVRLLKPYKISCRKGSERWVIKVYGKETSVTRICIRAFYWCDSCTDILLFIETWFQSDNAAVNLKAVSRNELVSCMEVVHECVNLYTI